MWISYHIKHTYYKRRRLKSKRQIQKMMERQHQRRATEASNNKMVETTRSVRTKTLYLSTFKMVKEEIKKKIGYNNLHQQVSMRNTIRQ